MSMNRWRDYLLTLLLSIGLAMFLRGFVIAAYKVPTGAMQPTVLPGDYLFALKGSWEQLLGGLGPKFWEYIPHRGEIVIFNYDNQKPNYLKRVIGLPGDVISMVNGKLVINDIEAQYEEILPGSDLINPDPQNFKLYREQILDSQAAVLKSLSVSSNAFGPLVVPPGEVFLLGDNRDVSDDSRYWGTVPIKNIIGRAWIIWFSKGITKGSDEGIRYNRIFKKL